MQQNKTQSQKCKCNISSVYILLFDGRGRGLGSCIIVQKIVIPPRIELGTFCV